MTTNNLVGDFLIDAGHTIFSAYDGLEALRHFHQESIELIILDIMLPNMDGIQVLKEIRKASNVPILMLTALSDEKTQINSFDALADDYIFPGNSKQARGMDSSASLFILSWSWKRDSNTRPAHYECAALPTELFQQTLHSLSYIF